MATLDFTVSPTACARLHDILTCLSRFDENVKIEAQSRCLVLTALNSSKTAHVAFSLDCQKFFEKFDCDYTGGDSYAFQMLNRLTSDHALLVIFRARLVDSKGGHSTLEKCEVSLQDDPDRVESRLVIKMLCSNGITKTYKLTYEPIKMLHAMFSSNQVTSRWRMQSKWLKEYLDLFAPKTELLDISSNDDEKLVLVSYTEKITNGREILKQPLETTVKINFEDFEMIETDNDVHVKISVKDFRNMVLHADTLRTNVTALYSAPGRPLQFSYSGEGIRSEFTLMTMGAGRTSLAAPGSRAATREPSARGSQASSLRGRHLENAMPPPIQAQALSRQATQSESKTPTQLGSRVGGSAFRPTPAADEDDEPMFVPENDDDAQWAPQEDEQDMLGWDASGHNDAQTRGTFRNVQSRTPLPDSGFDGSAVQTDDALEPTQRASEVRGLFD